MQRVFGWATRGAQTITVGGLPPTTSYWDNIVPNAVCTVYLTGTTTLVTIYADDQGTTKSNPFNADPNTGYWFFYCNPGRVDVRFSGATIAAPITLPDLFALDTGYDLSVNSGLTLNVSSGRAQCTTGALVTYAGGTLAMTASATNYVFLNTGTNCTPQTNTTGYAVGTIPLGVVTTTGSVITNIISDRGIASAGGGGSGGTCGLGNCYDVLDATLYGAADMSLGINSAIAALPAAGGTVDARGFPSPQTMSVSIDLKTASGGNVAVILPQGTINRATGAQFILENQARVVGQGGLQNGGTIIVNSSADAGSVFANPSNTSIGGIFISDLRVDNRSNVNITVGGNPVVANWATGIGLDFGNVGSSHVERCNFICQQPLNLSNLTGNGAYYNLFVNVAFAAQNPTGRGVFLGRLPNSCDFVGCTYGGWGSAVFAYSTGGFTAFHKGEIEGAGAGFVIWQGTGINIEDVYIEQIGARTSAPIYAVWQANWPYIQGGVVLDTNNHTQVCVTGGTSGGSQPSWNATYGGTTTDNQVTWLTLQGAEVVYGPFAVGNAITGAMGPTSVDDFSTLLNGLGNYRYNPPTLAGTSGLIPPLYGATNLCVSPQSVGVAPGAYTSGCFTAPTGSQNGASASFDYFGEYIYSSGLLGHAPLRTGGGLSVGGSTGHLFANQITFQGLPTPGAPTLTLTSTNSGSTTWSYALVAHCGGGDTPHSSFTQITNAPSVPGALISVAVGSSAGANLTNGDKLNIPGYTLGSAAVIAVTTDGLGHAQSFTITTNGNGYIDGAANVGTTCNTCANGGSTVPPNVDLTAYALVAISPPPAANFSGFAAEPWSGCSYTVIKDPAGGTATNQYVLNNVHPATFGTLISGFSGQFGDYGQALTSGYTPPTVNTTGFPVMIGNNHTPASSGETCTTGWFTVDGNYLYLCVAPSSWKRATLNTW